MNGLPLSRVPALRGKPSILYPLYGLDRSMVMAAAVSTAGVATAGMTAAAEVTASAEVTSTEVTSTTSAEVAATAAEVRRLRSPEASSAAPAVATSPS